jgi:hypothetical protein
MLILLSQNEQGIRALDLQKHIFTSGSSPMKSTLGLLVDKYENDTHAHVYHQYDTYVVEFHKKGKSSVADK